MNPRASLSDMALTATAIGATTPYTNKYVSDIPLKRPAETFVDDPNTLEEVLVEDLEFDLAHGIKDINRLHVFHAITIFNTMLQDLIRLSSNKELFDQFREQRLLAYQIYLDDLEKHLPETKTGFHDDDLPLPLETPTETSFLEFLLDYNVEPLRTFPKNDFLGLSPPLEFNKRDYQDDDLKLHLKLESVVDLSSSLPSEVGDIVLDIDLTQEAPAELGAFISTESLIQTTSFDVLADPITAHSKERLKKEVLYHMAPKIKQQAEHLLKCFGLVKAPPITTAQFLLRIKTYSPLVSVSVYIHSAYMIFKLCVLLDVMKVTPLNVYRLILALIRCLTKKLEDIHLKQKNFAVVGGVALKDLCKIEVSFLYLLNFKLVVSEYILNHFLTKDYLALRAFCKKHFHEGEGSHEV